MNSNGNKSANAAKPKKASKKNPVPPMVGPDRQPRQQRRANLRAENKSIGRATYAPAAFATGTRSMQPQIAGGRNSCRIVHRELVASISGSPAFSVQQTLKLNPGLAETFPWLATQAQSWEEYKFHRLKFCYYTRTGSTTVGSIQLAPDYDAADDPPASEQIASSFEDVVEDAPWKDLECRLSPQAMFPMGPKKFIRSGALSANQDIKTYDAGQLFICCTDGAAVGWGKLWVEYDVELFVPANAASGSAPAISQHITSAHPTTSSMLPTPVQQSGSANLFSVSGNVLTALQAGRFFLSHVVRGTSWAPGAPVAAAGGSLVSTYNTPNGFDVPGSGSSTVAALNVLFDAAVGSTLTLSGVVVAGTSSELFIARVPSLQT